ncbi:MAG TPA: hypothetical protein VJR92_09985 [Gemmatimonadaceae bacterium]|nr:hypothetical protein [Gemmatimonadaceae bacterium]
MRTSLAAIALVAVTACGGDSPTRSNGFVQLTQLKATPNVAYCGVMNPGLPYEVTVEVNIVNTTAADVTVMNVSSSGVIVGSAAAAELGQQAHMFATLVYEPDAPLVQARTGDVKLRIALTPICGPGPTVAPGSTRWREFNTTIYVSTPNGQYAATPFVSRTVWN